MASFIASLVISSYFNKDTTLMKKWLWLVLFAGSLFIAAIVGVKSYYGSAVSKTQPEDGKHQPSTARDNEVHGNTTKDQKRLNTGSQTDDAQHELQSGGPLDVGGAGEHGGGSPSGPTGQPGNGQFSKGTLPSDSRAFPADSNAFSHPDAESGPNITQEYDYSRPPDYPSTEVPPPPPDYPDFDSGDFRPPNMPQVQPFPSNDDPDDGGDSSFQPPPPPPIGDGPLD